MTSRDWMAFVLKILGVWFATRAILALVGLMAVVVQVASMVVGFPGPGLMDFVSAMLHFLAYAAITAVLLVFTDQIVERLYPESTPAPPMR